MNKILWPGLAIPLLIIMLSCTGFTLDDHECDVRLMSFNLRYDNKADAENQWSNRKDACIRMMKHEDPAIIGIQEGLYHQVEYIHQQLPAYAYVGVARDDGEQSGEYSAIYFDTTRFELLEQNTFWLSATPKQVSLGWDAACKRIVTWAKLKDVEHHQIVFVFNTHLDHEGMVARRESAKLLVRKIMEIAGEDQIVFVTGDFNAEIEDAIMAPLRESFSNARVEAKRSDQTKSFNGFGKGYPKTNIDYLFYRNAEAGLFKTINDDYGVPYISDHYPLIGHFTYKTSKE